MEEKKIFWNVQEAVEWLNEKDVNRVNFEEIVGNYVLEVEGMSCLHYKCYNGDYCLAFFKVRNDRLYFKIIEIISCAFVKDLSDIVNELKEEDFLSILEKYDNYLDTKPFKAGESVVRVFENWVISNGYEYNDSELIRLYEYYALIETAKDIAKKYANKKINAAISVDALVK